MLLEILGKDKNIFHIVFKDKTKAGLTMLRMQEFYESPYSKIQGNSFDLETYIEVQAEEEGSFSYLDDAAAFNIPGPVVLKFWHLFKDKLSSNERELLTLFNTKEIFFSDVKKKGYLVATIDHEELDHELAHAMYFLYKNYRSHMDGLYKNNHQKTELISSLTRDGYGAHVMEDEIQAYMATCPLSYLRIMFPNVAVSLDQVEKYRRVFIKGYKEYIG